MHRRDGAKAYCELEDLEGAESLYARLALHAERNAVGAAYEYKGAVAHYLGRLALLRGDRSAASSHLAAALKFNEALGMSLQSARTRALLQEARGASGIRGRMRMG